MNPLPPNSHEVFAFGGLLAAFFAIYVLILVIVAVGSYVLYALALSMFFRKVGVEPWIGWVPVYSTWKWLEVGGQPGWIAVFSLVPYGGVVTSVFVYIGMWRSNIAFRQTTGMFVLGIFLPFVWLFIMASKTSVYEPDLIRQAGFGPPLAGFGAMP